MLLAASGAWIFLPCPDTGARAQTAPARSVLFFTASWCEPCRAVYPVLKHFADRHGRAVRLVPVDFDRFPEEAARWGVNEIPVVIVISRGGALLLRSEGADRETLRSLEAGLERLLRRAKKKRSGS